MLAKRAFFLRIRFFIYEIINENEAALLFQSSEIVGATLARHSLVDAQFWKNLSMQSKRLTHICKEYIKFK